MSSPTMLVGRCWLLLAVAVFAGGCAATTSNGQATFGSGGTTSDAVSSITATGGEASEPLLSKPASTTTSIPTDLVAMESEKLTLVETWPVFGLGRFWFVSDGSLQWFDPRDRTTGVLVSEGVEQDRFLAVGAGKVWFYSGDELGVADPVGGDVTMVPVDEIVSTSVGTAVWEPLLMLHADDDSVLIAPFPGFREVVRVSASGEVLEFVKLSWGHVLGHSLGPDGDHWVVSLVGEVFRLDAETLEVASEIEVFGGGDSQALVDGELWISNGGVFSIIDTATGEVVDVLDDGLSSGRGSFPYGILGSPVLVDGSVWVGDLEPGMLQRLDPATRTVQATVDLSGHQYAEVFGGVGSVWVSTVGGAVREIDARTGETLRLGQFPDSDREWIIPTLYEGSDGLWVVADTDSGYEIHEILPLD